MIAPSPQPLSDSVAPPAYIPLRALLLVAAVAAFVTWLFVWESGRAIVFQIPTVDSATYHYQAESIIRGDAVAHEAFWQPPLYPYTLALIYKLGLTGIRGVRAVHGLAVVAAALLTVLLARRVVGSRAAIAAGLVLALYGPLLFFATQLLPTGLAVVFNLLALLTIVRLREQPSVARALACGVTFGLAALVVPTILACALAPVAWILLRIQRAAPTERRPPLRLLAAFAIGVVICIAPVTIRNRVVSGEWVLISTNGGINLYIGNNSDIAATLTARPGLDWERLVALPFRNGANTAGEAQDYFLHETRHYILTSPIHFLRGLFVKAWWFLGAHETPRNLSLEAFCPHSILLRLLVWEGPGFAFPFGIVGAAGMLGLVSLFRRGWVGQAILLHTALFAGMIVLFFPASRYRLPVVPLLVIAAALAVPALIQIWRRGNRAGPLTAIAIVLLLVNWPRHAPTDAISFTAELHKNVGVGLQVRGRVDHAIREYRLALASDPEYADAHYYLGTALRLSGERAGASAEFMAAIKARPNHEKALHDLGVLQYEQGRVELAASLLRRALETNPRNVRAMQNLALAEVRLGHADAAQALLRRARAAEAESNTGAAP